MHVLGKQYPAAGDQGGAESDRIPGCQTMVDHKIEGARKYSFRRWNHRVGVLPQSDHRPGIVASVAQLSYQDVTQFTQCLGGQEGG